MLRLESTEQRHHGAGHRAEIHGRCDDHVVVVVGVDDVHVVAHNAFRRFHAAAAVHARRDVRSERRDLDDLALERLLHLLDERDRVAVRARRPVHDKRPLRHAAYPFRANVRACPDSPNGTDYTRLDIATVANTKAPGNRPTTSPCPAARRRCSRSRSAPPPPQVARTARGRTRSWRTRRPSGSAC